LAVVSGILIWRETGWPQRDVFETEICSGVVGFCGVEFFTQHGDDSVMDEVGLAVKFDA